MIDLPKSCVLQDEEIDEHHFQQDNNSQHTSRWAKAYFDEKKDSLHWYFPIGLADSAHHTFLG